MENVQHTWKQTTAELYKAVLIFTLAGVAVSVFAFILSITATVDVVAALNSGDQLIGRGYGVWNILSVVATVAVLYGYWLFVRGLGRFAQEVKPADAPLIANIRTATLLMLVAAVVACLPVIGFAGGILNVIGWIMLLIAYSNLKNSATFPVQARAGARRLFIAMVLDVVGWCLGWIPFVGPVVKLILALAAFWLVISGWKAIAQSEAPGVGWE
ncbi:hypothetical protein [uncultured Alistipes sp.]|nr:hypothetical protein [uncultured Alistipes sp.]